MLFFVIAPPIKEIPEQLLLFDNQRNQWKSNDILQWLSDKYNKPSSKSRTTKILALCDFDAYSGTLNFVFGQTHLDGSISATNYCEAKTRILWIKTR
jgi:predicted Zn-dependent protease